MSEAYEEVFTAFMNNKVPAMWHRRGYNSLKSLGSWIHDLTLRVDFIEVSERDYQDKNTKATIIIGDCSEEPLFPCFFFNFQVLRCFTISLNGVDLIHFLE